MTTEQRHAEDRKKLLETIKSGLRNLGLKPYDVNGLEVERLKELNRAIGVVTAHMTK